MICYLDYIENLIKDSASHWIFGFSKFKVSIWVKNSKRMRKENPQLPFLPRKQSHYFNHCYLVSLFWVASTDRELVSCNSIITLPNSPLSLVLFEAAQCTVCVRSLHSEQEAETKWCQLTLRQFPSLCGNICFSCWIDSLSETWPLVIVHTLCNVLE